MGDNFSIELFTPETVREHETDWLTAFLRAGLNRLHLRKPGLPESGYEEIVCALPAEFRSRIVIHDHPELARRYGCGIQLNRRNPSLGFRPALLSASCHSRQEMAEAIGAGVDFVTLSPVFDSISKTGYSASPALDEIPAEELSRAVALGGVTVESLTRLKRRGFAGAALLGEVWNKPDGCRLFLKYLRLKNVGFQFITNGRNAQETIGQALDVLNGGGRWIQVRMKDSPIGEIREVLAALRPECEAVGATLIVDDRHELLDLCHGVHLGQNDAAVGYVRSLASAEKIIGLTVNSEQHLAASMASQPDYYGVGPFRFTRTKKNLAPELGIEGYRRLAPLIPRPFVAIGGIEPADIAALKECGVRGVAISSAITKSKNKKSTISSIIKQIYE